MPWHQAEPRGSETSLPVHSWVPVVALGLSLIGLSVSAYLTVAHFSSPALLACSSSALVDCRRVTTSAQSEISGIPVALLGVLYFIVMGVVNFPPAWRSLKLAYVRLGGALLGIGMVLYLLYAEFFLIGAICLWCSVVHVDVFLLFLLTMAVTPALVRP